MRNFLWRKLRECKILSTHKRVARICEALIDRYRDLTPGHKAAVDGLVDTLYSAQVKISSNKV